ncbi:Piezo-type mechanosensitive ion channel homolog [Linum perenne]
MDFIMSGRDNSLTVQLLTPKHSYLIRQSRSGVRHTNFLLRGAVFRTFCVNFFTYGFPISLLALSFWSFHFASFCAFALLAYVGYVLYAIPSVFRLHRLNGLLLVFILLWAASTYVFNLTFLILNKQRDMEIWETIGLWHYPIPGFYLFAQFCLGVLVALGNLVNNSVFQYLSDLGVQYSKHDSSIEDRDGSKVLIIATVAWVLRKTSRVIVLVLIFLIALRPGLIHALYMVFFMIYLLSHTISRQMRQYLILLCEAHFALTYFLQLNLISNALKQKESIATDILRELGFLSSANSRDFLKIGTLACFCALHNHGFEVLSAFSAIVQHTPCPPIGFGILRAGLVKSILLYVYTSRSKQSSDNNSSHEKKIASYLTAIGQNFRSVYRSCGTYIALLTVLLAVYRVRPNHTSFGYLFFLMVWMVGRQHAGRTTRMMWLPLKVYAIFVFILLYGLSVFFSFQKWLSKIVDVSYVFGYDPNASMLENIWESLGVLAVMQLYSYERRQSKRSRRTDANIPERSSFSLIKRLLIWHGEKILNLSLFYASLSPISGFGFLYLVGMVACSTLPKSSWLPSKFFVAYSGFLLMVEYLFQLWGDQANMLPGQKYYALSLFLGLRVYEPSFTSLELGLRGKVLVIVSCLLRYNVFHWLRKKPSKFGKAGKWDESCALFSSSDETHYTTRSPGKESEEFDLSRPLLDKPNESGVQSWTSYITGLSNLHELMSDPENEGEDQNTIKERHNWTRKQIHMLRNERLRMQIRTLKVYIKFWIENIFNLFGLEINMIALLIASFAVLNTISLLYVASLAAFILLPRHLTRKLWPMFVFLFGSVITLEYLAIWLYRFGEQHNPGSSGKVPCNNCWESSDIFFYHCKKCWLGIVVDDPCILISYYVVFLLSCFKFRADRLSSQAVSESYQQMISQYKSSSLNDLSFATKYLWTVFDYLRLYSYCHLLDLVLALILVTGTLEFDVLHLGYLGFALVFFRMRLEMLKKKNQIFRFLRMYNFAIIVLSLAYQSPYVGNFCDGKCGLIAYVSNVVGFYKYDYGFRITSRSALVEIIIYMLVSLQSYMFSAPEFDYVAKYIEAEQKDARKQEQEKRAAWKTEQLQQIRKAEEQKRLRNLQVEKMKSEMLNLQIQLQRGRAASGNCVTTNSSQGDAFTKTRNCSLNTETLNSILDDNSDIDAKQPAFNLSSEAICPFDANGSPVSPSTISHGKHSEDVVCEITEIKDTGVTFEFVNGSRRRHPRDRFNANTNTLIHLFNDGVSQVQSLGNMAVNNLVHLLNIKEEDYASDDDSSQEEIENQNIGNSEQIPWTFSIQSEGDQTAFQQIGMILRYIWAQMRSNNDIVCYCCFVLVFLWNFSLFSMAYPAVLFLYALFVNTGPSNVFWVIILIYTEMCILAQYIYQITIQRCGMTFKMSLIQELGFPPHKILSSFVLSNWPLFLVYLFTLLQTSITARDNECVMTIAELSSQRRKSKGHLGGAVNDSMTSPERGFLSAKNSIELLFRNLYWFWQSLTRGAETPPYFVQLSMKVDLWPEEGIPLEKMKSVINKLLKIIHDKRCQDKSPRHFHLASKVRAQSVDTSPEDDSVALAVFEVLYASPLKACVHPEYHTSLTPAADVASEILEAQLAGAFKIIEFPYPVISVIGGAKKHIDLYAYIFCADLAVFFLVAIFYQSVMKNNSEFLEVYQLEDQFPEDFVCVLMVIFFLIVLDRVIYLCSFATGKLFFYLFNIVLFTYAVTKYAWKMEPQHSNAGRLALRAIYLAKAVSLTLQAIQIHHGIPHESTLYRQFLTSSISRINYLGFRLYRALPFLYELRCVLDWSCTTTSLTMYDWLKLEDIHASLFLVKCDADLYRAKHQQGQKQAKMTKFCNGICLFFILMCVIWAPMLMYSSGNPTNIANPIKDANVRIEIRSMSGKLTLYETTLCEKIPWERLDTGINLDPRGYLSSYNKQDIQLICCQADASTLWRVPDVVQDRYMRSLPRAMDIIFSWQLTRDRPKGKEAVKYELVVQDEDLPSYSEVMQVLNGTSSSFNIKNVYPRYFRVTGSGDVRSLEQMVDMVSGDLVLNHGKSDWWSFHDTSASSSGCGMSTGPMAVIISEETPQGIIGETLSKFSIWGLYITFVLAVGRFIRLQCSDLRMRIPFENLPSCERLLAICENIYAARAEGELEVEEVLYWTLVKIFRTPHMLLEYTNPD